MGKRIIKGSNQEVVNLSKFPSYGSDQTGKSVPIEKDDQDHPIDVLDVQPTKNPVDSNDPKEEALTQSSSPDLQELHHSVDRSDQMLAEVSQLLASGQPEKGKLEVIFRDMISLHKQRLIEEESIRTSLAKQLAADIPTLFKDENFVVDFLMEAVNQREGTVVVRLSDSSREESFLLIQRMTEVLR